MKFDRRQSAGYVVNQLARLFAQALYHRTRRHGVTPGEFPVLLMLWEQEGATQAELARRLAVGQPTLANTLRRMERDRLIERLPDPEDGRRARIHLTAYGKRLEKTVTASARDANAVALAGLSGAERQQFLDLAHRLIGNLEQEAEEWELSYDA